jgi:hypothetical protein
MTTPVPRIAAARLFGGPSHGQTHPFEYGFSESIIALEMVPPEPYMYGGVPYPRDPWDTEYRQHVYTARKVSIRAEHWCVRHVWVDALWMIHVWSGVPYDAPVPGSWGRMIVEVPPERTWWFVAPPWSWLRRGEPAPPFDLDPGSWRLRPGVIDFEEIANRVWLERLRDELVALLWPDIEEG